MIETQDTGHRYEVRGGSKIDPLDYKVLGYTDDPNEVQLDYARLARVYDVVHVWAIDRLVSPASYDAENDPITVPNP